MVVYPIDAPSSINAFLAAFGNHDENHPSTQREENAGYATEKTDERIELPDRVDRGIDVTSDHGDLAVGNQIQSSSSSPAHGLRAPPPTPVTHAANADGLSTLEPIEEVDDIEVLTVLAETQNLTLKDSKFASTGPGRRSYHQRSVAAPSLIFGSGGEREGHVKPTQTHFAKSVKGAANRGFVDQVVKDFKSRAENEADTGKENVQTGHNPFTNDAPQSTERADNEFIPLAPKEPLESNPQDSSDSGPKLSPEAKEFVAAQSLKKRLISKENHEHFKAEENEVKAPDAVAPSDYEGQEFREDREHLTHFRSWGPPSARDKPRSRVRKIILTDLPINADLTLIQGLIHGGSIESFKHLTSHRLAQVTFVSADACDSYYDKYPNGIVFRHNGKSHTSFVHKGQDVDVVSGMLQGYLDCGASRCVKAVGADGDWGIVALHKLAEGKNGIRKVEAIFDAYRNSLRTIVFRFTSIADAVKFKGVLVRSEDWDACNIQFMDDPCEKATNVHLE